MLSKYTMKLTRYSKLCFSKRTRGLSPPSPQSEAQPLLSLPWNDTLYRSLWRVATLGSSFYHPLLTPHFEKSRYTPEENSFCLTASHMHLYAICSRQHWISISSSSWYLFSSFLFVNLWHLFLFIFYYKMLNFHHQ